MAGDAPAELYAPAFNFGADPQPLLHLAEWINGLAFKNIAFTDDGLPVVKIAEIKSGFSDATKRTNGVYDDRVRLRDGDLLFCWSGQPETSIGTFVWDKGDAWLNQHIFRILPDKGTDRRFFRFLMLYLQPNFQEIARNKQTTGLGHVTKGDLGMMMVQLPSRPEQERIADALQAIQDKLDLNRKMTATLEEMARALFKSWFVDFDPVHAKAEGRETGLSSDVAALFPDSFDDGGLPLGWMMKRADEIARSVRSMANPQLMPPESPYVGLEHLPRKSLGIANHGRAKQVESGKLHFKAGDLLFGKLRPYFHKVSVMPFDGIASSDIFVFRAKLGKYRGLMYFGFSDEKFVASASGASTGTRMPRAEWSHMSEQQFATDDGQVLEVFNELALSHVSQISERLEECRKLEELRDTLLPKLLSGELRVADAEPVIAAA
jgi:type I restriction enzyme, S subunit